MKTQILSIVLALASSTVFAGTITNGDFATNDLTGWTSYGYVSVAGGTAKLEAGMGQNVYTTLSQTVHMSAGDTLSGEAQFFAKDYIPFNDDAYVWVNGDVVFYSSVAAVGNYGTSALTTFNWIAPTDGDFVLTAGVANQGDNSISSELHVSDFSVTGNVPEPASLALMGLGLAAAAVMRRKAAK